MNQNEYMESMERINEILQENLIKVDWLLNSLATGATGEQMNNTL